MPKFLAGPVDLDTTNVGAGFVGHDISSIFKAVKESPFLQKKTEFETTGASEARRLLFATEPIFGRLRSSHPLAFVVEEQESFKYDADSQTMSVRITGRTINFFDNGSQSLDTVRVHRVTLDRDKYIGSNSFGAKVEVDRTYRDEFGIAFPQSAWIFRESGHYDRQFNFLFAMDLETARAVKADLRIVLVCRLTEPYFHSAAHGHDAIVSEPYETVVGDSYLDVDLLQVLVINWRTGQVLRRVSEPSTTVPQPSSAALFTPSSIIVDGAVQANKSLRQVKAPYPPLARQARIEGLVRFKAVIGKDGHVQSLSLISGHPLLVAAATQAVEQWVYSPAFINGVAVDVNTTIDVDFRLSQ